MFGKKKGEEGGPFRCVSAHRFSAEGVVAHSGTPHTSEVCMKAGEMWDLHELHVPLLGGLSQPAGRFDGAKDSNLCRKSH